MEGKLDETDIGERFSSAPLLVDERTSSPPLSLASEISPRSRRSSDQTPPPPPPPPPLATTTTTTNPQDLPLPARTRPRGKNSISPPPPSTLITKRNYNRRHKWEFSIFLFCFGIYEKMLVGNVSPT